MRLAAVFLAATFLLQAADPLASRARGKLAQIKEGKVRKGSVVIFTEPELNSWIREELAEEPGLGVRETRLVLDKGTVSFDALADFGKLAGNNSLVQGLIGGERPLKIVTQPETAAGKITVHLSRVEISGVPLSGVLLNFAAKLVISMFYDDVEIDQPTDLGHSIDHAVIDAGTLRVYMKK